MGVLRCWFGLNHNFQYYATIVGGFETRFVFKCANRGCCAITYRSFTGEVVHESVALVADHLTAKK